MPKPGKLDRFDHLVPAEPWSNPWQSDGSYRADLHLLTRLLEVAVGTSQQSGVVAGAVDVWAAEELRRAGFHPDEVWPRRTAPRVLPRDVRNFVEDGLTKKLRAEVVERYSKARTALPAEAHVLGRAYSKQIDVLIASWPAGVELLISTKTMLSSYQKNLRNRFEEGYGDAKNLRGRHPLAALGFLFVTGADIPDTSLSFAIDMLRKLTSESDVYECACLLVLDGVQGKIEEEATGDERSPDQESAGLVVETSRDDQSTDSADDERSDQAAGASPEPQASSTVRLLSGLVPPDLSPAAFFGRLITAALDRMPVAVYPDVRARRAASENTEA
jgi:hypothetical protein